MHRIPCHFCGTEVRHGRHVCEECIAKLAAPNTATDAIKAAYAFAVDNGECSEICDRIARVLQPFAGLRKKHGIGWKTAQDHRQEILDASRRSWARSYGRGEPDAGSDACAWRFLALQFGEAEARRLLPEFVPDPDWNLRDPR